MSEAPLKAHEWISFEDADEERTWVFDVTFLESNWTCIFGNGCQGVLTSPAEELVQGCCSHGAHFVDKQDIKRVEKAAKRLSADQWQFKDKGKDGITKTDKDGDTTTKLVKGACIFLNRPDFHRGAGCALHVLSMDTNESYIPLKPEVCWQLPLRREEEVADNGHITSTIMQWDRKHWGEGGDEFHWWCTESPDAFIGKSRVVDSMSEELIAMVGQKTYDTLLNYLSARHATPVPHPAIRRR